ncbi:hypothetical protein [Mucilaginibacter gossypiicola]|uniref:hypothetical protein n=1 Tax=Mucilaginibacter gossypiicola TaxID=551995 RepID=UPI001AD81BD7|nr:hypothetical protein [Mucilaginibacter gossypiicola]
MANRPINRWCLPDNAKTIPNSKESLVLVSSGDSTLTLAKFDMRSDNSKWTFNTD